MINTWRPRQICRHFPDDIFKCIFLNENVYILIIFSLRYVPKGSINNIPALVQIMAWRWPGDNPLSEPMLVSFLMHMCVTQPQWFDNTTVIMFTKIAKFMGPTWGPPGSCRPQMCPTLAPWTLLSGHCFMLDVITHPYPNFNGSLAKLPLEVGHEWVITSHSSI